MSAQEFTLVRGEYVFTAADTRHAPPAPEYRIEWTGRIKVYVPVRPNK